jgi:hypothetical protein
MNKRIVRFGLGAATFMMLGLLGAAFSSAPAETSAPIPPPNEPAKIESSDGRIRIVYAGQIIFEGAVAGDAKNYQTRVQSYGTGDKVEQVVLLFGGGRTPLKLGGTVRGSDEAFPCEADRRDRRGAGPLIVRHVSGLSRSFLNRAVYDRRFDWVLSVDAGPAATVTPIESGAGGNAFSLSAEGGEIVLRFRPRFYNKHRGLPSFEPWTYKPWPNSVAGWISWFAFFADITERNVTETAEVFGEVLRPFGYDYFQIDDGYQRGTGAPENWLTPNGKFPNGLKSLADAIRKNGLKPGIWTAATVSDKSFAEAHPQWFVRDGRGTPVRGNWIGFALDASNSAALEAVVRPLYRGYLAQGWDYFKLDALRHLRNEGYNANRTYFADRKLDLVGTYRRYVQTVRDTIGPDKFLLACWGVRPELTGLVDACRIGDDGFAYAGLAQYNSFNNVVWRNDPDHIELNEDAYRSTLVTTLTGSLFMLTDKPAVYRTPAVEPAKRTVPVLTTRPGQIYDVDPSRSQNLWRADVEVSGSGPRVFDGGYTPACFLYQLEIDRPFENWTVLGRTGGDISEIRMSDLGLDPVREYYIFEFWSKSLLGGFRGTFAPGPLDPKYRSQAFVIRESRPHPQLIATSRHVTGGGVDVSDVLWEGSSLAGKSRGVKNDPYVLYITEPAGFTFAGLDVRGAKLENSGRDGRLLRFVLSPDDDREFTWSARFNSAPGVR